MRRVAVERMFEIISEASRFIPEDMKAKEKDIAWQRMADLGNWLRHAYHRIDAEILWNIAQMTLNRSNVSSSKSSGRASQNSSFRCAGLRGAQARWRPKANQRLGHGQ